MSYKAEMLVCGGSIKPIENRRINPVGKVPAIAHRGQVATEVAAIAVYLAETFPSAGLVPLPEEGASYYRWLFFVAVPMEAAVTKMKIFG